MPSNPYFKTLPVHFQYWRLVFEYVLVKHKLHHTELDTLLFLQPFKYFTNNDLRKYNIILKWNPKRRKELMDKGFIYLFDDQQKGGAIYGLTKKAIEIVAEVYSKTSLSQTMSLQNARLDNTKLSYTNKVLVQAISHFNEEVTKFKKANGVNKNRVLTYQPRFNHAGILSLSNLKHEDKRRKNEPKPNNTKLWDDDGNPIIG